jgi:hypothetical protein
MTTVGQGEAKAASQVVEGDSIMAKQIKTIAPVVVPSGGTQLAPETIVFGLDEEGGLWKWDTSQQADKWTQVCKPLKA